MNDGWIPDLSRTSGPKYLAIAEALEAAIEAGVLLAKDRLPPQRDLARTLGIDLTTVTRAYDIVRKRGLIDARGRAGSFVVPRETAGAVTVAVDTGMIMPPRIAGGALAAEWERTMVALLRAPAAGGRLHYQPAGGSAADRAAGARLIARLGLASSEDQIVVTAGAQNALHAIVAALFEAGDVVACNPYVYPGFLGLARRFGLKLVALERMEGDALDRLCRRERVKALYLVPTNDNPTTHTIPAQQRAGIAEVARRHGVQVIEDDAYGQLAADPAPPVTSFVPELGWYVASTSKTIAPALRVAHVRAPDVGAALRLTSEVHESCVMPPPLNAALVTAWLETGTYDALIAETRAESRARQALAAEVLSPGTFAGHPCGYHLWVPLADVADETRLGATLRDAGLSAIPASAFAVAHDAAPGLRVSLGGPVDREQVARALRLFDARLAAGSHRAMVV